MRNIYYYIVIMAGRQSRVLDVDVLWHLENDAFVPEDASDDNDSMGVSDFSEEEDILDTQADEVSEDDEPSTSTAPPRRRGGRATRAGARKGHVARHPERVTPKIQLDKVLHSEDNSTFRGSTTGAQSPLEPIVESRNVLSSIFQFHCNWIYSGNDKPQRHQKTPSGGCHDRHRVQAMGLRYYAGIPLFPRSNHTDGNH
ncbi:uncharacterized protein LOC120348164 [Styela clava]